MVRVILMADLTSRSRTGTLSEVGADLLDRILCRLGCRPAQSSSGESPSLLLQKLQELLQFGDGSVLELPVPVPPRQKVDLLDYEEYQYSVPLVHGYLKVFECSDALLAHVHH
jgi:hypothetical protein